MSRDIIAAIDGALNDWAVSADAMRWTPEPAERVRLHSAAEHLEQRLQASRLAWIEYPARVSIDEPVTAAWESATDLAVASMVRDLADRRIPIPPQAAELEMLRRLIRPQIRQINEAFREFMRAFEKIREIREIRESSPSAPDDPGEDVRARALRLRQTRNTGPAKPAPGPTRGRHR